MIKRLTLVCKNLCLSIYLLFLFFILGLFYLTGISIIYWIITGKFINLNINKYI
jgi:hypothetical protein